MKNTGRMSGNVQGIKRDGNQGYGFRMANRGLPFGEFPGNDGKGYLVRTESGVRIAMTCFGQELFFDATNPDARSYVWSKIKQNYWDKGARLCTGWMWRSRNTLPMTIPITDISWEA